MTTPAARAVAEVLETRWGWRFDGPGARRLDRALAELAAATDTSVAAVAGKVAVDAEVRRALLDRATVQETSWFRDAPVFRALANELLPAIDRRPVRFWSAGCALGQEVWSLAMLCAERGIACEVVGSDVSRPALARAAAGVYEERELRGLSSERRERWLEPDGRGRWRVRDALRRGVRFASHDLIAEPPPLAPGTVDLVLCRYVLIYLSPEGVDRVLRRAASLLRGPTGRLVLGGAESLWHLTERFELTPLDGAFAYRPAEGGQIQQTNRGQVQHLNTTPAAAVGRRRTGRGRPRADAGAVHGGDGAGRPADGAGGLASASVGPDPGAGVGSDPGAGDRGGLLAAGEAAVARGDLEEAVRAFRGAAYVDPDSALAHLQLGLALEASGDLGAARAFRAAAAALQRRGAQEVDGWRAGELMRLVGAKLGEAT